MASYAVAADFAAFVEGWFTTDAASLERLLGRAERDVDSLLGAYARQPATGLKLDPAALTTVQANALSRATCAQAEYRFEMGEEFFVRDQHDFVAGPDFSRRGSLARIGPKVLAELADNGFVMAPLFA